MDELYTRIQASNLNEVYLFHRHYYGERRTRYIWNWQYGTINPFPSVLIGGKNRNGLIATQGMFSINLKTANGIELTGKNESLLIEESYRGLGLSKKLYNFAIQEYKKENITCLWGFSRKAIIPLQRAGFKVYFNVIQRSVLSLDVLNVINIVNKRKQPVYKKVVGILTSVMATITSKILLKYSAFKITKFEGESLSITNTLRNNNDLLSFYETIREKFPNLIHINQDYDYYNWRVELSPRKIKKRFLYFDNQLVGYLYLTYREQFTEVTDLTFFKRYSWSCFS
jgi:GNAT superfamily N-acetyltransferase